MKISFVIPAHNEEHYIAPCLESIFREVQMGGHDAQIIVVNNASDDGTEDIVSRFPGVQIIREERKGTGFARMAGLLAAEGDLFATIDADTRLTEGWIETALGGFERDGELVGLSGPCIYFGISRSYKNVIQIYYYFVYLVYIVNHNILKKSSAIFGGNFIARRKALHEAGGYNTDLLFWGDDADLAKRLVKRGKVKFTFDLKAHTSGRRLQAEGLIVSGVRYIINHTWIILFNEPFHKEAVAVRLREEE